ncbi:MAG: hypothetical protein ABJJ53_06255 [Sulfitobacter sp.]
MTETPNDAQHEEAPKEVPVEAPVFDPEEVLAVARPSAGRRLLGIGSLGFLGFLVIYLAIVEQPGLGWRLFLLALGVFVLLMTDKMRRATASYIELTPLVVRDHDGTIIARIEEIDGLDRGFFAFKPSNGFLMHTENKAPNEWRPGMWWRIGRRIGVGGMTPAHHTKQMSEILAIMIAQREMAKNQ